MLNTQAIPSLGPLVQEYKLSTARVKEILFALLLSVPIGSCFLVGAFSQGSRLQHILLALLGLFCALPFFAGVYQLIRLSGVSLSLYENGLTFRRRGSQVSTTWEQVAAYYQESACRIVKQDGAVIEFGTTLEGINEVAEAIQAGTLPFHAAAALTAIRGSGSTAFAGLRPFESRLLGKGMNTLGLPLPQAGLKNLFERDTQQEKGIPGQEQ